MNEIGEKLREARESHGVSIEEAAEDLKIRPSQLKNLEDGNIKEFKDIFYVKFFVRDYAKYLGLDGEKILDDFNEFLFDYTSRIPLDKIKKANNTKKEEPKKIVSPYTVSKSKTNIAPHKIIYVLIVLVLIVIGYLIANSLTPNSGFKDQISYNYVIE
ncbi:MAG: helix-turn-helix domain-containing protein [Bacilli bacterium]|nr:helix-turn-helix domain-containing protein [Bacilli bacterium]